MTKQRTKNQKEIKEIDYYKLSLYFYNILCAISAGFYNILCAILQTYKQYKEKKNLKTYIRLREKYINIAGSDEGYKKDMMFVDMANYKPKTIVDMRDKALERYIKRLYNV